MSDNDTTVIVDERGQRNLLPILLGVLGGIVVLALLWFFVITPLLLGDDAGSNDPVTTAPTTDPTDDMVPEPTSSPSPEPTELVTELPETTYEVYLSRDPFEPVREDPVADDGTTDGDGADDGNGDGDGDDTTDPDDPPTTDPDDPVNGTTPPPGNGDGNGNGDACTGDGEVTCDGHTVTLVDVAEDEDGEVAVIQVDTTVYEVREREVFAESFGLLSIDGDCATILFGDEAFTLCEGDRVLK